MSDEQADAFVAARASLDQIGAHHDMMAQWLEGRARVLREAGLPEAIQEMMLARLVDIVFPVEDPVAAIMVALAQEAQRRQGGSDQEEGDDE